MNKSSYENSDTVHFSNDFTNSADNDYLHYGENKIDDMNIKQCSRDADKNIYMSSFGCEFDFSLHLPSPKLEWSSFANLPKTFQQKPT